VDIRSFSINYGLDAVLYDERLARELEGAFERDLGKCRPFDARAYRQRSAAVRFRDLVARLLSPQRTAVPARRWGRTPAGAFSRFRVRQDFGSVPGFLPAEVLMSHALPAAALHMLTVLVVAGATRAADAPARPAAESGWGGYNGGYDATRFSPLTQIDTKNVAKLREVGRLKIPETLSFQCGPVVVGDTMYVTTVKSTYAVDARTGEQRWVRTIEPETHMIGTPVRGVAYADGRLFRGTMDGHVLALDAKTGDVVWDMPEVDYKAGEYYTAAPVVWNGMVFVGNSGSDMGGTGHVRALDARTGKRIWNFDNIPTKGEPAKTWPNDPGKIRAGGGMYSSFALDPDAGLLYCPVGNPGPDFVADYRKGDNLYTCGVICLDAKTGELKGYRQFVKNDFHDWDVAASPILLTSKGGRKMAVAACKNGYLYGLSRDLRQEMFKTPVTRIEHVDAPLTPQGTRFLPGTQGGTNWYGPAYSPPLNLLFVPTIDWATTVKLGGPETLKKEPGKPFIGSANAFGDQDPKDQRFGHVTAVDADTREVRWKYDIDTPMVAALTPTAGGVLLTGDTKGNFLAFDAATGKVLLQKDLGDPIGGGIVTYTVGGTQFVAVAGGMKNGIVQTDSGPAWVAIFALPDR
jgi:alcohol dehydrogenase (cytochrome c)